ncbi:MAG: sensor histidine kinase [Pseudorhodobacter sp.]
MSRRWRPSLGFVLGGALIGTLALSFAGLVTLRYLGPVIGFRNAAMILGISIAMATAVLGWLLVRLLLRPIRALEAYADAQEQGGIAAEPRHLGTRELHATARRVVAMAEALRDRETTIRAFTDHVTHEIRTPVSAIRAASELLEDGRALDDTDAALVAQINGASAQIDAQITALREVARAREARYIGRTSLAELLPDLRADWPGLDLVAKGETRPLPIAAPGLSIVLGQLLRNAHESGAHSVVLEATAFPDRAFLNIADDGPGIASGNAGHIFDPFFTTRRDQGGTGMGLTIVRNLLHAHGATIQMEASSGGVAFSIRFARVSE